LKPDDWTIFNRRQTFRVRPNPRSPLSVILQKEGGSEEGQVIDISLGGIGIQLESLVAETLLESESIMLSLPIPGYDVPMRIQGAIRYLKKERESHRVGIAFSSVRDESFVEKEKAVSRYVLTRQREIIGTVEGS
jgi:c-di-GMP-binding flagellar brake protein YcgR